MSKGEEKTTVSGMNEYTDEVEKKKDMTNCDFSKKSKKKTSEKQKQEKISEEQEKKDKLLAEEVTDEDIRTLKKTLHTFRQNVLILEENWNTTKKEFNINESQIKQVYQFNEQHRDPMPEGLSEEEQDEFDQFNGIDKMSNDDITSIFGEFGENNPIIGVDTSQTIDRIKHALGDFFGWLVALRQYNEADLAYMQLIELQEEQYILKLKMEMENVNSSEELKEKARKSIENYYYYKHLKFLAEPLDEATIKKLVEVYGDEKKIGYWINRSREKLDQAGLNQKIILEISKFEINYLEEKYHCISNTLLLRFLNIVTFTDMGNPNDSVDRTKVLSLTTTLDGVIRNIITGENKDVVMNNIRAFLDQMIEPLKKAYPKEVGKWKSSNS